MTRADIDRVLSDVTHVAIARKEWKTVHAIAHIEAGLFGYDPDCAPGCPYQ